MKLLKYIFTLLVLAGAGNMEAQIFDPVKWAHSSAGTGENEYTLIFKATIEDGWKVYATDIDEGGPVKTDVVFEKMEGAELIGELEQLGKIEGPLYEPLFEMDLKWFKKKAILRQKVKVTSTKANISGYVTYMTCDDQRCLPPTDVEFSFSLEGFGFGEPNATIDDPNVEPEAMLTPDDGTTGSQNEDTANVETTVVGEPNDNTVATNSSQKNPEELRESKSLWGYFIAGIGGGLLALLTPCVFPLLPLTVSFFTKSSKNRRKGMINAITYALSIITIFLLLGFLITIIFGPSTLNEMASNIYFNIVFFVVFIVFAISFFGAFEITLPSSIVNKADSASDRGGLIGIFFMAFTLVLVSFSCTAPIVGSLLVMISDSGEFWAPLVGMLGFSLALAVPFALFAAFPGWLNSLPKSGGWMNTVKVTLGFIELALALKFLSVIDLAYHWNFLTRDIFIALWIIIAVLMGFYFIGKIRFAHDSPMEHLSITRLFLGIVSFALAIYMIPGMWGAPVKLLSGIAPPQHYQEFSLNQLQFKIRKIETQLATLNGENDGNNNGQEETAELIPDEVINVGHCPHELACFFDYERALDVARKTDKPLLLDFTGWSCVNCRKMEDYVWSDERVWEILNNEYVLVSLYVDDKTLLPDEYRVSKYTNNKVRSVGKLWSDMQTEWFKANSQPYYVLLDHNETVLVNPPKGYTPDVQEYINYLNQGIVEYNKKKTLANKSQ